jgi:hypothetical protein
MSVEARSDTASLTCHWCRHLISVADIIDNGPRPDCLIPFTVPKDEAISLIREHLDKLKTFATPAFLQTFHAEMIRPVYLPYAMGDFHFKVTFSGEAVAIEGNRQGNDPTVYYDTYSFVRRFHLYINDLLVEANWHYTRIKGQETTVNSKNIVNSILPFDTSKLVDYDPKFLNGDYRAEFRDMNFEEMKENVKSQFVDISVFNALMSMGQYTSGHKFLANNVEFVGDRVDSVLCPLWLYSYQDKKGKLNYICVNGQTGETAACIPVYKGKLLITSFLIEVVAIIVAFFLMLVMCA